VIRTAGRLLLFAFGFAAIATAVADAQGPPNGGQPQGGGQPVYQRRAFDRRSKDFDRRFDRFDRRQTPQVSSAWFQRPYPYHLDYYKMRYGGTYAPYFGNLYGTPFGTPQVVNGGWGPSNANWGPEPGAAPQQGYEWQDGGAYPNGYLPGATAEQQAPVTDSNNQNGAGQQKSESLPAPNK
jgi:hypothetical protein